MKLKFILFLVFIHNIVSQNLQGSTQTQQGPPPQGGSGHFTTGDTCDTKTKQLTLNVNKSNTNYPGGSLEITGDGCPGYDWTSQKTPNTAKQIFKTYYIPMKPTIAKNPLYVGIKGANGVDNKAILEAIGVAANGVAIYANGDANNLDSYVNEGQSFDKCGGHPTPFSEYHYHMEPSQGCAFTNTSGKHSPLFGIMFDGIPFFGELGDNGVAPTDLDECGGHVDKTHPYYHYHLPKDMKFPYTLTCLRGCIYNQNNNPALQQYVKTTSTCEQADKQYDYSSFYNNISVVNGLINSPEASNGSTTSTSTSGNMSGMNINATNINLSIIALCLIALILN
jgi:hypothetical protein